MTDANRNRTDIVANFHAACNETASDDHVCTGCLEGQDITKSAALYRDCFSASGDAMFLFDLRGRVLDVNRKATELFLYSEAEFHDLNLLDLLPDDTLAKITAVAKAVINGGSATIEGELRRKNGTVFVAELTATHFKERTCGIVHGTVRDISSIREVQSALANRKEFLRGVIDMLPDRIYFKDKNSRFTLINKAAAQALCLQHPDEAVGRTDFDFFTEEHAAQAFADEQNIMRISAPLTVNEECVCKAKESCPNKTSVPMVEKEEREMWFDGRETWVSTIKSALLDANGLVVGTFGVSRDITKLKRIEDSRALLDARVWQADKMESLGMLASGIAHDFNNLLMGMLGNASLALTHLSEKHPVWHIIKQVETAALRAADLTKQLLAYAGHGVVRMEVMNLGMVVKEMASLLDVSIPKNVALRYAFPENLPLIEGDPTQIRQVIMNLITNASDAIGKNTGSITISTGVMDCDETFLMGAYADEGGKPGKYVYMEVCDTGCGLKPGVKDKMFDPFFTTKPTGRGLGLASVLGIVRGHKGAIKVDSEPGQGTTFKIFLRASERPTVLREKEEMEKRRDWHGVGVALVVDDEDIIRDVSSQMMGVLGFEVITASSGEEALTLFEKEKDRITIVLLDEVMPRMEGEGILSAMRQMKPDAKIVLCSGYSMTDMISRFEGKEKPSAFLQKPFTLHMLADCARSVLAAGSWLV